MATEKRDGLLTTLRSMARKAREDFRNARSPEEEGVKTRTAIVRTGRFRLPKLRTLTSIQTGAGRDDLLEVQTKRGLQPDKETIQALRFADSLRRDSAAGEAVRASNAVAARSDGADRGASITAVAKAAAALEANNFRTRVVLGSEPRDKQRSAATGIGSSEEEARSDRAGGNGVVRTSGPLSFGAGRMNMKIDHALVTDPERLSNGMKQIADDRSRRDDLARALRPRGREGR